MPHELPPLPYPKDALAPVISAATMEVHYGKHHKGYVDKVNKLVLGTDKEGASLEDLVRSSSGPLAHAAAQAWNHAFFWRCLTPTRSSPGLATLTALTDAFGSLGTFETKLKSAANDLFGSGWVWLVRTTSGNLELVSTPNAGLLVHETPVVPLLTVDVWEHAYYLDYKNERARYVDGVWQLLDWRFVEEQMRVLPRASDD